jgi:heme/copper-type cytochrome/quinol oxidase subunit 2
MNASFKTNSVEQWLVSVKSGGTARVHFPLLPERQQVILGRAILQPSKNWPQAERNDEMMYMTLTLMAGLIAVMFVATAVSSIINSLRENAATRDAQMRRAAF